MTPLATHILIALGVLLISVGFVAFMLALLDWTGGGQ